MKQLVIVGDGAALDAACQLATQQGLNSVRLELPSADRYNFQLTPLVEQYACTDADVFVALDGRGVNYSRHKLIAQVRLAGYRTVNLISNQAIVDDGVRLMSNVYIGPGCNLAGGVEVGLGCWLDRQVTLDQSVTLGACVTLLPGVVLGRAVTIGKGSTLSSGTVAIEGTQVGHHCEWLLGGRLPAELPDQSFYDALMPEGARILNA